MDTDDEKYIEGVVLKGENAESILTQYMTIEEFHRLFRSTKAVYDLSKLRQDYSYGLITSKKSGLKAFEYQINRSKKVVVVCRDGKYTAAIHPVSYEIYPRAVEAAKQEEVEQASLPSSEGEKGEDEGTEMVRIVSDLPSDEKKPGEEDADQRIDGVVRRGDSAQVIFSRCMSGKEFANMLQATKKVYNLARIRQDHTYTLVYGEKSGFRLFEYQIDSDKKLIITRTGKNYTASISSVKYDVKLAVVEGKITSSLFNSVAATGENPDLAVLMADILAAEINFIRDIRSGDSYQVAIEKLYSNGKFRRYGRILGVRFKNRGTLYEGFRFPYRKGVDRYYNAKGESLHKTLLKAPLSFTRISSHYSASRKHPIFKDIRAHFGVDYAAPTGTPVKAVGDGTVTKVGWGTGFGRMVIIRHENSVESMYSHLSRYAKNIKKGTFVRQGQLIGYVGSSGWATGPHLDFRIRRNGQFINPEKVISNRSNPVSAGDRKRFNEQKAFIIKAMEGKFPLDDYKPGMLHLSAN